MTISELLKKLCKSEGAVGADFAYTITNQLAMSEGANPKDVVEKTLESLERLIQITRDGLNVPDGSLLTFMSSAEKCPTCKNIATLIQGHGVCGACVDAAYDHYCPK